MSKCNQDINNVINEEKLRLTQAINNCNRRENEMNSTTTVEQEFNTTVYY